MPKITVGILCGGKSPEHEVSLQSALSIFRAINRNKYNPVLIGINKQGGWNYFPQADGQSDERAGQVDSQSTRKPDQHFDLFHNPNDPNSIALKQGGEPIALISEGTNLASIRSTTDLQTLAHQPSNSKKRLSPLPQENSAQKMPAIDVIFPVLHGPLGEDGCIQGLLRILDTPFVGSNVLGSALGMDKDIMKRVLASEGLPLARSLLVRGQESPPNYSAVVRELGSPFFVKPANMGSSVGVAKVRSAGEYERRLSEAFAFDFKVILEEFIDGREFECAVLGNAGAGSAAGASAGLRAGSATEAGVQASLVGEVVTEHDFYSYTAKYLDNAGSQTIIPADIPADTQKEMQSLAIRAFRALNCEGLSRVDFFLSRSGQIIINEINTMPGFTRISMYPKLWEASGLAYPELINRLIELAFASYNARKTLRASV